MVLGSQQHRRGGGGGGATRRKKSPGGLKGLVFILLIAAAGYLGYAWLSEGDTIPETAEGRSINDVIAEADRDAPPNRTPDDAPDRAPAASASTLPPPPSRSREDRAPAEPTDRSTGRDTGPDSDGSTALTPPDPVPDIEIEPVTPAPAPPPPADPRVTRLVEQARRDIAQGNLLEGRERLNDALAHDPAPTAARDLRHELAELNERMIFSPQPIPGDPHSEMYVVQSGDVLERIAKEYNVPWQFLSYINNNLDPRRLRAGARIKVVRGPFHAVVRKSDFRIDTYLGAPGDDGLYIRSFDVGLGEAGSTPVGEFLVESGTKLINPEWTNPRTREVYRADDPQNPLGERWIGLRGVGEKTAQLTGYGIHGTIEPETIGTDASMGCVRLRADDIALLYAMLQGGQSRVIITNQ